MRRQFLSTSFAILLAGVSSFVLVSAQPASGQAGAPASAEEAAIPARDLSELYPSADAWKAELARLNELVAGLDKYKGTLGNGADALFTALDAISTAHRQVDRLQVYADLRGDEDVRVAANQENRQLAQALQTSLEEKTAWVTPELLEVGATKIKDYEQQKPDMTKRFGFYLDNVLRGAPHTLGPEAEHVLAAAGSIFAQPNNIYSQLADGELPFPTVTLSDGTKAVLDQAGYSKYRQVDNRDDRKKVFDAFWAVWNKYKGTLGAMLTTQVLTENYDAKIRNFPDALAAALFPDNMPEAVYRQLVAQANAGLPAMYRYLRLRKKLLGISGDLSYYDTYPSMFHLDKPLHFSVQDLERLTLDATAPYGPEYAAELKRGFAGRWMDVLPRPGKQSGAYMQGSAYDVHPYLHLNHNFDYDSLSTFAHEWGHAVHTMLDKESQPYETFNYSTFIAETASISNEMLLNNYMVAHAKNKQEKLYYLGEGLEMIRGTFFRQTMFAEFQAELHDELQKGQALSGERMTEMYCNLLRKYNGEAQGVMKIDPAYCIEWAFVPHFYYGFYVYQYATSMAGAAQFTDAIEKEGAPARDRYIAMLKAGGSDYPYNLYKKAGIDMASPAPYQALVARMNRIMDQIDALLAEK